jgi:hypothetical protein
LAAVWRGRIDDGDDPVDPLWKGKIEHDLLLAPRQRARHQLVGVAGDDKMPREIIGGKDRDQQEAEEHGPRIKSRQLHQPCAGRGGRKLALGGLSWSDELARVHVNSVAHSASRQRDAGPMRQPSQREKRPAISYGCISNAVETSPKLDLRTSLTCEQAQPAKQVCLR